MTLGWPAKCRRAQTACRSQEARAGKNRDACAARIHCVFLEPALPAGSAPLATPRPLHPLTEPSVTAGAGIRETWEGSPGCLAQMSRATPDRQRGTDAKRLVLGDSGREGREIRFCVPGWAAYTRAPETGAGQQKHWQGESGEEKLWKTKKVYF